MKLKKKTYHQEAYSKGKRLMSLFCKHTWTKKEEIKSSISCLNANLSMEERVIRITYIYICTKCGKIRKVKV
jgi:hypothetical protein